MNVQYFYVFFSYLYWFYPSNQQIFTKENLLCESHYGTGDIKEKTKKNKTRQGSYSKEFIVQRST